MVDCGMLRCGKPDRDECLLWAEFCIFLGASAFRRNMCLQMRDTERALVPRVGLASSRGQRLAWRSKVRWATDVNRSQNGKPMAAFVRLSRGSISPELPLRRSAVSALFPPGPEPQLTRTR